MIIDLQKGADAKEIEWQSWQVALHGVALDDRGGAVVRQIEGKAAEPVTLVYDPQTLEMEVAGNRVDADAFPEALRSLVTGSVVLEATTLGFVEILLCCRALHDLRIDAFDIVYLEPGDYHRPRRRHLLHRRDFELSGNVSGYRAIPGHGILLRDRTPHKGVFFLGYEEARLRRAFEDLQMIRPSVSAVALGVPAFRPGWEMDAIANNIGVIREQNISGGVHFCGAENPVAVIEVLSEILGGLEPNERLFVAPIGTKPHGIGVALFVSQHRNVGIIYDHPQRTRGRTSETAHWHLFSIREYVDSN